MDKKNSEGSYGNFNAPNSPVSPAAPSLAHACQSQTLNLGFLINDTDDVKQNQLDSPSSPAAHDDSIDSTINFCELNQFSVAFSENSLEHESTSQASLEVHYNSSPKPTTYSLPPGQSVEPWDQSLNGEISSGESKCSNTVRGKTRKPSTKRKHPEETRSHDVVNGEINDGEHTGQSQQHEQKCRVRTSKYRGVSRGNIELYEAFLWDNSDPLAKPKTVYVGGFADEEAAARAYDLAALKIWGLSAQINFPLNEYEKDLEEMKNMNKKEYLATLRRKSKGFSKGVSIYRGVSRNPKYNKWQARLGKGKDTKGIYLGTFESEEEAAKAYDVATIRVRGMKAFTNFNIREYNVKSILESAKLPIGNGISKFLKENSVNDVLVKKRKPRKLPILNLEEQNTLSSSQANPPLQSSAEEENIQNQLNEDGISCGVEHNPNSFPVHGQQNPAEFQTNPSSDTPLLGENLAVIKNGENSISGLLSGFEDSQHLTAPDNEKITKHVLHEYPSSSLTKSYQHPSSSLLQAHQNDFRTFLTGDGDGNAFQINGDLSGNIEQGVSSDEVLVGNTTLTDTNENTGWDFFQEMLQIAPCENFLQLLGQQNQDSLFHLNESDNHQNHDFEANSSLLRGLTEIDFRENSKSTYEGEISSVGILKGNSAVVETEKNANNGGSNERRFPSKRQEETIEGVLFKDVEDDDLNSFSSWLEMELMEKNLSQKVQ